jgi:hypothetical protein
MNKHLRNDNAEPGQGRHYRTDAGTLRKPHRTDEGFVVVEGVAAFPGVYPYRSVEDRCCGHPARAHVRDAPRRRRSRRRYVAELRASIADHPQNR